MSSGHSWKWLRRISLASIYNQADLPDRAEEYYRQALVLQPENPYRYYNLAKFLIDKDRNVTEGIELIEKASGLGLMNSIMQTVRAGDFSNRGSTKRRWI